MNCKGLDVKQGAATLNTTMWRKCRMMIQWSLGYIGFVCKRGRDVDIDISKAGITLMIYCMTLL